MENKNESTDDNGIDATHAQPRYPYLHVPTTEADSELMSDRLWTLGATGVEERSASTLLSPGEAPSWVESSRVESSCVGSPQNTTDSDVLLVASFPDLETAERAQTQIQGSHVQFVVGDAWRHAYRAFFKPTRVSERILLCPSWEAPPPLDGATLLTIDPGNAFGSGLHETTRLVLREVDRLVQGGERVLDVGYGSGILSVAALLLGAENAVGTEVDESAPKTAMENAENNGVAEKLEVFAAEKLDALEGPFDLVLANIRAIILIPMAQQIARHVDHNKSLVLCGVLEGEVEDVVPAFEAHGLSVLFVTEENEWRAITMTRLLDIPEEGT